MFGDKIYELSLVKDYVSHWGLAEAARELIQNALDSNSPFQYEFQQADPEMGNGSWVFKLNSINSRLEPHHLLLGSTTKAQDPAAIGSFGEGFKIAMLVLTRLGCSVNVYNNERVWVPFFRHSKLFGTEVLAIREVVPAKFTPGLSFWVSGLSDEDRATIEAGCLKMQSEIGEVIEVPQGQILLDRPGELYVGSLFVTKNDMHFGYNVNPDQLSLERDRQTVSDWDLRCLTRDMWYATGQHERIAQMIFDDVPDLYYARYAAPELVAAACYKKFKDEHPGALIAESPSEMKKMIDKGLTKTVYVGSNAGAVVKRNKSYTVDTFERTRVPTPAEFLKSWFNAEKKGMKPLTQKHFQDVVLKQAADWRAD